MYAEGKFTDLCRGPHVPSTGKLKLYNDTGGDKKIPTVFARCTADLGKR